MAGAAPKSISATAAPDPSRPGAVHLALPRARSFATVVLSIIFLRVSGTELILPLVRLRQVGQSWSMADEILTAPRVITGDQTGTDSVVVTGAVAVGQRPP